MTNGIAEILVQAKEVILLPYQRSYVSIDVLSNIISDSSKWLASHMKCIGLTIILIINNSMMFFICFIYVVMQLMKQVDLLNGHFQCVFLMRMMQFWTQFHLEVIDKFIFFFFKLKSLSNVISLYIRWNHCLFFFLAPCPRLHIMMQWANDTYVFFLLHPHWLTWQYAQNPDSDSCWLNMPNILSLPCDYQQNSFSRMNLIREAPCAYNVFSCLY